ncbi:HAD family hydrolase [Halorubrum ezzemoulense]|uniref:HAD family hydrolase n=1 Tax=Halorubrum ezzemoulense TaxID=337243 RepID=A0ABT4Z0L9_HALEZ|nr:HAD family hydrolase [Halorubrum ezzemoulense]MDB2243876.1 HAD family hydrolase [Halorubrum ezzemoulense]MDB2251942.1 HAD family hydrolase [Halorubrum ezzemoulense]MDB2277612.1 HAD family hydrolase [Halorubrum ezzemoulense]MDB2284322.1 HAD family hydrolase [Halorubrum ezzemoulense]MDB2289239.1 HAD family hydrolase [Halorubrum ezzemoulense]
MSYEAVLFDLDNTLYPYAPCNEAGKRAALDALRERGYELDRAAFDDLYATGRREAKRETRTTAACHDRHVYLKRGLYRRSGEPDVAAALAAGDAYWDGFLAEMSPCDGVEPAFDALDAAGIDVAVVTNLTTRIQLRKLTALGVDDRIDLLVTSEEVGREKPSALPFTTALAELDRRPSEALAVGDNPETDVAGANAVGLDTALFVADGDAPAEADLSARQRPDRRLDALTDLTEVAA